MAVIRVSGPEKPVDPLEASELTALLTAWAGLFGPAQNLHVSYTVNNVAVNISMQRFDPPTDEEE